jgi:hypothetical protein
MNKLSILLTIFLLYSCEKQKDESEINDLGLQYIHGSWNWIATCGGFSGACAYPTNNHFSKITFDSFSSIFIDSTFYNDTIIVYEAKYSLTKTDKNHGALYVEDKFLYNISLFFNILTFHHGTLHDSYEKIE